MLKTGAFVRMMMGKNKDFRGFCRIAGTVSLVLACLWPAAVRAEETSPVSSPAPAPAGGDAEPAPPAVPPQVATRSDKTLSLTAVYTPWSFLVPGKRGAQVTYIHDERWTWEAEYFSGDFGLEKFGLNLLSLEERLTTVKVRKYWNSTFNLTAGLGERRFAFELGNRILDEIAEDQLPEQTLIEVHRYIFTTSLGNRWHFPGGFVVGADWLDLAVPFGPARTENGVVALLKDEDDRRSANRFISYLQKMPTISLVKVHLGYAF